MFRGKVGLNSFSPLLLSLTSCTVPSAVLVGLFTWLHSETFRKLICMKKKPLKHKITSCQILHLAHHIAVQSLFAQCGDEAREVKGIGVELCCLTCWIQVHT